MIRPSLIALMLGAASLSAAPAFAQTQTPTQTPAQTPTEAPSAQAPDPGTRGARPGCQAGTDCPRAEGRGMDRQGQGRYREGARGGHHGGGHGGRRMHHRTGPTLRIKTEGRGFEIEFECNAEIEECLEAIERVYRITGEARRRGGGAAAD